MKVSPFPHLESLDIEGATVYSFGVVRVEAPGGWELVIEFTFRGTDDGDVTLRIPAGSVLIQYPNGAA